MDKVLPECSVCGTPTNLSINGVPVCYDCYQADGVPAAAKPKPKPKRKRAAKPKAKE